MSSHDIVILAMFGVPAVWFALAKQGVRDRKRMRQVEVVTNPRRRWL